MYYTTIVQGANNVIASVALDRPKTGTNGKESIRLAIGLACEGAFDEASSLFPCPTVQIPLPKKCHLSTHVKMCVSRVSASILGLTTCLI